MDSEWRPHETVVLLAATAVLIGGAYFLTQLEQLLAAILGILVLSLWVAGAMGRLGLSGLR